MLRQCHIYFFANQNVGGVFTQNNIVSSSLKLFQRCACVLSKCSVSPVTRTYLSISSSHTSTDPCIT